MASPAARMLAPGANDPAPAFAISDKSGKHVRIYACAQREALLNKLHASASTKLGIKLTGELRPTDSAEYMPLHPEQVQQSLAASLSVYILCCRRYTLQQCGITGFAFVPERTMPGPPHGTCRALQSQAQAGFQICGRALETVPVHVET